VNGGSVCGLLPKICVSIAEQDITQLEKMIELANQLAADYVEIRFDFVNPKDLSAAIAAAYKIKRKGIFTLRPRTEGGRFSLNEEERLIRLRELAIERPMLLDVEFETLRKNDSLADFLEMQDIPILVSWHDFAHTPSDDKITQLVSQMRIYSNFIKIVTTANNVDDSLRLLRLSNNITEINSIIFAMGEAGVISRILCTIIGNAPFTYAALGKAVAPGQLTLDEMKYLYNGIIQSTSQR
jgi:3-dehydroquinate dehydratase-1